MRTMPRPTTVDFETFKITSRPHYPPKPVGVSIKEWGKPARYWSWGHPTDNNCTLADAKRALAKAWKCKDGVLFHHGKFDQDVAETHMGMPRLPAARAHDTLFLLYLYNPHSRSFQLKPSAEIILKMAPEERDAVVEWLMKHKPVIDGTRLSNKPNSKNFAGAYVAHAPGDIVGRYANGDVVRTAKLFAKLYPLIVKDGMLAAYMRERRLLPHLLDNERQGVPVDVPRLERDTNAYLLVLQACEAWIRKRLGVPDLNVGSGQQLGPAMVAAGKADPALMGMTVSDKPRLKTDKQAIRNGVTDKLLAAVLQYHSQLSTCVNTFMLPWLETARLTGGLIHTTWNQVRNSKGAGDSLGGTRTGRLSSTPNFQNIPKEFREFWETYIVPLLKNAFIKKLPPLPLVRSYIVPFKGEVLIDRDFSQQEFRILAHFEDDVLRKGYDENPWMDVHDYMRDKVNTMLHRNYPRGPIKNMNFGIVYGMGLGALAERLKATIDEAKELKRAIYAVCPKLADMYAEMRRLAEAREPMRTWGGRLYYCEEPAIINGRVQTFDYKMVNYKIQGSAADCTKEAIIRYCEEKPKEHRMLLQVHDQVNGSVPTRDHKRGMKLMQTAMESIEFDVPMLSEGKASLVNWAELKKYDVAGKSLGWTP